MTSNSQQLPQHWQFFKHPHNILGQTKPTNMGSHAPRIKHANIYRVALLHPVAEHLLLKQK
jgi:hypothetical protein